MKTSSFSQSKGLAGRISIARYAPRWEPKANYESYRALAPGKWFNSVKPDDYIRLYYDEILAKLDPAQVFDDLQALVAPAEPILLCWENIWKPDGGWCHRRIVSDWFADALKIEVPELPDPKLPTATAAPVPYSAKSPRRTG